MNLKLKAGLGACALFAALGFGLYFGGVFDEKVAPPTPQNSNTLSDTENISEQLSPKAADEFNVLLSNLSTHTDDNLNQEEKDFMNMLQQRVASGTPGSKGDGQDEQPHSDGTLVEEQPRSDDTDVTVPTPTSTLGVETEGEKQLLSEDAGILTPTLHTDGAEVNKNAPVMVDTSKPAETFVIEDYKRDKENTATAVIPELPKTGKLTEKPAVAPGKFTTAETRKSGSPITTSPVVPPGTYPVVAPKTATPSSTTTTTSTSSPINELNSKDVKSGNAEKKPKITKASLPVVTWVPNPSNLEFTYLGKVLINILDLMSRLEKAKTKEETDAVVVLAKSFFKSLVADLKTLLNYNFTLFKKYSPFSISYMPGMFQTRAIGLLIDKQLNPIADMITADFLRNNVDNSRLLVMFLMPLVNPFDSFASVSIDDEATSVEAFKTFLKFIFSNDEFDMESVNSDAVYLMQKFIRQPVFIEALKKVYAETDFSSLLAAKTEKEFFMVISIVMKNLKSYPALMMIGSVTEESTLRILYKLLARLLNDPIFIAPKKCIKKVLTLIQTFTITKDYGTEVEALINEATTLFQNQQLAEKFKKVNNDQNVIREATELFGGKSAEYWEWFGPQLLMLVEYCDQLPMSDSQDYMRIVTFVCFLSTKVGISMTMIVQLLTRLTSSV